MPSRSRRRTALFRRGRQGLATGVVLVAGAKGGGLAVAHGGPSGFSTSSEPVWVNQDTAGVPGTGERRGDGITDAGAALVLRGSANGLTGTGGKAFTQSTSKVPGTAEKGDRFGAETALVDADGDKRDGLVVGDPDENATSGSVWVFSPMSGGITATGSFSFGPATVGVAATKARFGVSVPG